MSDNQDRIKQAEKNLREIEEKLKQFEKPSAPVVRPQKGQWVDASELDKKASASSEFSAFRYLTERLLAVPSAELHQQRELDSRGKAKN